MAKHHRNWLHFFKKTNPCNEHLILIGVVSLFWFIFRTGTKPTRITYPCQKAALGNSSVFLSLSVLLWLTSILTKTKNLVSKNGISFLILLLAANLAISGGGVLKSIHLAGAADPNRELFLSLEPNQASSFPASNLYVCNGHMVANINELINFMGSSGSLFYESEISGANQGPNGLIAKNDVILIKINEEWPYRGGTNTDILKQLIQALVNHPEGFVGEIVVADNGQWQGSMDWAQSNAEDTAQSTQDVVNMFSQDFNVSTFTWISIRGIRVNEYSEGDMTDGYVLYNDPDPETGIYVSYPKFSTEFGTPISFKKGIWNGTGYDRKLKVINMPVLKTHSSYGVTAALKHYMGVQSQGEGQQGLANGHSTVATGGMGSLMVETGLPTLNIIDAIWVNANPSPFSGVGPSTPYNQATRVNVLLASTDPVALDYWASKHVLMQTASLIGYTDIHTIDPDNKDRSGVSGEAFGVWLSRTENEISAGGYQITSDENKMNIFVRSETPSPTPESTATPSQTGSPSQSPSVPSVTPSPTSFSSPTPSLLPTDSPYPTPSPPSNPNESVIATFIIIGIMCAIVAVGLMMLKKR